MTESLTYALNELRARNEPVPRPLRLPTSVEIEELEAQLGITFSSDFRRYLLEVSDVVVGTLEPVTLTEPNSHTYFPTVLESAREYGVPEQLLPFCEDNADYYSFDGTGRIVYWSHDGATDESWPNLATWIKEVWLQDV